jgi:hypothetical protein
MIFWLRAILDSIRPWSQCCKIISGHNCGSMWKISLDLAMFVLEQKLSIITFMVFFNHCWSLHPCGFQFPWTSSQTFHLLVLMTPFVMVDCLTNMVNFIPCTKTIIGGKTTKLFLDHVFQYHGLLENIIFNHGLQFVSKF